MNEPTLVPRPVAAPTTDRRRLHVLLGIAAALVVLLVVAPRILGGDDAEPFDFPAPPTSVAPPAAPSGEAPGTPVAGSGRNPFVRG